MSAQVPPPPPPLPEPPKHFATMLIGISLIVIGAILINQGMSVVQADQAILVGVGLIAAGALLVFAAASGVWPGSSWANFGLLVIGIILLIGSGTVLAANWGKAIYGIAITILGIALIVVGVQVAKRGWAKYASR